MTFVLPTRRLRYGMGDTTPITGAGDLQSITGANVPIDAEHVSALQRELNRYADPKSPYLGLGAPLAVSGVLDDATASRAIGVIMLNATQTGDAGGFLPVLVTLPLASSATRIAWVASHITTVYSTAKAFADAHGLPAASGTIPLAVVVGAAVVGAYLLFGSKRKGKRRK